MARRLPERFEAPGLVIRRETPADAELIAAVAARELEHLAPWMPWATADGVAVAAQRERLASGVASWDSGENCGFLVLASDDALQGIVGLHRRIGPRAIEIGYWLKAAAVGHGYVTRSVELLTRAALALDDIDRVEIHCDASNVRSAAVPRRLGYRLDRIDEAPGEARASTGKQMVWIQSTDRPGSPQVP